jgi:hypothetical protein
MNLEAEQHLDLIYHALPRWVHARFKDQPLADKVKNAIQVKEDMWWREVIKNVDERSLQNGFTAFLCQKLGIEFGQAYWDYLQTPDAKEVRARMLAPKIPKVSP